jgi:hypothetical protein
MFVYVQNDLIIVYVYENKMSEPFDIYIQIISLKDIIISINSLPIYILFDHNTNRTHLDI